MSDKNLRFDDVIIGWSDTTPNSATASATSGGGYVKLDDSFLTGETIVTLPVSKKLYAVDDNGNLKKDDNGNAIEASWNEQSLHKLRKGFITSVSSSPLSLVYKAGSQGVGFLARTTTINLAVAAATRFSNSRQRSKYITCDATFINPNDPASMTSTDGSPGRFTIKNAKLNVLSFEPEYWDEYNEELGKTTSTDIQVNDSIMFKIGDEGFDSTVGRLNIGLDFETISRTEEWDTFLNEVAGTRNSTNRLSVGFAPASCTNSIMKLELSIHQNGLKSSSNQAIGTPTFSFLVTLLPRDNLGLEYDVSSPYVSRNYSFRIVKQLTDNIKFSYINDTSGGIHYNFTISGHLDKKNPIKIVAYPNDNSTFINLLDRSVFCRNTIIDDYDRDFINSNICVTFEIDEVKLLARGRNGIEFDKINPSNKDILFDSFSIDKNSEELFREISNIIREINDGLYSSRHKNIYDDSVGSGNYDLDNTVLPILTILEDYAQGTVETKNFFDFLIKSKATFRGISLLESNSITVTRPNTLTGNTGNQDWVNSVKLAVFFSFPNDCDEYSLPSTISNWEPIYGSTTSAKEGGVHMYALARSNSNLSLLDHPSLLLVRSNVQIMQQNNKKTGLLFYQKRIPQTKSDVLLQFVFQYEKCREPIEKYYHSFTITRVGWTKDARSNARYLNSEYVKIDEFRTSDDGTGYITLYLTAPYSANMQAKSFLDYRQKLDHHNNFASDLTLTDMAIEDDGDKNYYNINIRDNYLLAQELLSRFNGKTCYEDSGLVQREIYLYRHEYDRNFNGTPQDQLHANVQKFRVYGIEMELSDWKSSFIAPGVKKDNIQNLMTGPRQVKIVLKIDRTVSSSNLTTYAKDTRLVDDDDDSDYIRSKRRIDILHAKNPSADKASHISNNANNQEDVKANEENIKNGLQDDVIDDQHESKNDNKFLTPSEFREVNNRLDHINELLDNYIPIGNININYRVTNINIDI